MKSDYPPMVYRRQTIAQLLWALRSLRRSRLSREETLTRLSQIKVEAGPAFRYVTVRFSQSTGPKGETFEFALDKRLLMRAESKHRSVAASATTAYTEAGRASYPQP
jgi:hypothetical protein